MNGWISLLVELHLEGSAPAACAAGLFQRIYLFLLEYLIFLAEIMPLWEENDYITLMIKSIKVVILVFFNRPRP